MTAVYPAGPAPVYLATAKHPAGPAGTPFDPMLLELLDGGGGVLDSVLREMGGPDWREVTILDVLNAVSELYEEYRTGFHSSEEAARWHEDF